MLNYKINFIKYNIYHFTKDNIDKINKAKSRIQFLTRKVFILNKTKKPFINIFLVIY